MKIHLKLNPFIYFVSNIMLQKQKYLMSKLRMKDFKKSNWTFDIDGGSSI